MHNLYSCILYQVLHLYCCITYYILWPLKEVTLMLSLAFSASMSCSFCSLSRTFTWAYSIREINIKNGKQFISQQGNENVLNEISDSGNLSPLDVFNTLVLCSPSQYSKFTWSCRRSGISNVYKDGCERQRNHSAYFQFYLQFLFCGSDIFLQVKSSLKRQMTLFIMHYEASNARLFPEINMGFIFVDQLIYWLRE